MDAFLALADPTRREIIASLAAGEQSMGDIASGFEISGPAVSQHLRVLREAGLVSVRRDAQRRIYRLEATGLGDVERWLEGVRKIWPKRLERLEQVLREPPGKKEEST